MAATARALRGNRQRSSAFRQVGGGAQRVPSLGRSSTGQASEELEKKQVKEQLFFPKRQVKVCIVGSAGSGKSALGNFLFNPRRDDFYDPRDQEFKTGEDNRSCTSECEIKTVESLHIMDTPGLNESASKDFQHLLRVVKAFESFSELNAVILAVKFGSRMDVQWKQTVQAYQKLLGKEVFDHSLILVLTGFDPSSPKYRSAHVGAGLVERIKKDNEDAVKDLLNVRRAPLIWAIDSMPDPQKPETVAQHEETRKEILEHIARQDPVSVKGVKVPKTREMQQEDLLNAGKVEGKIRALEKRKEQLEAVPQGARDEVSRLEDRRKSVLEDIHKVKSEIEALDTDENVVADGWSFQGDSESFRLDAPSQISKTVVSVNTGAELHFSSGATHLEGEIMKAKEVSKVDCQVRIYCPKKDLNAANLDKLRDRRLELLKEKGELSWKINKYLALYPDFEKPVAELRQEIAEKQNEVSALKATHLTIPEAERRSCQT